jgi:hypothetical protein
MRPFFPLHDNQWSNTAFQSLPPTAKLLQVLLMSLKNQAAARGKPLYASDAYLAAKLGVAIRTIEESRYKLLNEGLITRTAGFIDEARKGIATTYVHVRWSQTVGRHDWSPMPHYALDVLLHAICEGHLTAADVVLYLFLWHRWCRWHSEGKDGPCRIQKGEIKDCTGLDNLKVRLQALGNKFGHTDCRPLIDYTLKQQPIEIHTMPEFPDPIKDADARLQARIIGRQVELQTRNLRQKKQSRNLSR